MDAASALQPQQSSPAPLSPSQPQTQPITSLSGGLGQRTSAMEDKLKETEDKLSAINAESGAMQPPTAPNLPPPPTPQNTNPIQQWGSAAMAMAAIGSLLTRQPLTTALNSAAGVMKAYKQNDIDTANAEFERWKVNTDYAIKMHNFQLEAYKAALAKASTDSKTALAEFTAYAHAFGDETAAQVAQTRQIQGAEHLMIDRERLGMDAEKNAQKIIEGKAYTEAAKQLQTTPQFQKAGPQDKMVMLAQLAPGNSLPQQTVDFAAKWIEKTGKWPPLGMQAGGARAQILTQIARDGFGSGGVGQMLDQQAQFKSDSSALGKITQTQSMMSAFEDKAKRDADLIASVVDKGTGPSQIPALDAWLRAGGKATGDPDVVVLNTAITSFKNEYAKIKAGSLGSQGSTDTSRNEADSLINANMTKEQIKKNIAFMKLEMANSIKGLDDQKNALNSAIIGVGDSGASAPAVGTVQGGYTFKGGDPGDQSNWSRADDSDDDTPPDDDQQ